MSWDPRDSLILSHSIFYTIFCQIAIGYPKYYEKFITKLQRFFRPALWDLYKRLGTGQKSCSANRKNGIPFGDTVRVYCGIAGSLAVGFRSGDFLFGRGLFRG